MATDNSNSASKISGTKLDIYSKLLAIASNYTDIEDTDYLKNGLFGYITESMALLARDSSIHKSMLYNESFLNTAIMPKSIYNWAKMFNINVLTATPAYATIVVTIAINDLATYSKPMSTLDPNNTIYKTGLGSSVQAVIIDKDDQLYAGEIPFTLEHSIIIYRPTSNNTSEYNYIVRSCINETKVTTSYQENPTEYLASMTTSGDDGAMYLTFSVRAYQYDITEKTTQINNTSYLNNKVFSFEFDDSFAGATLSYLKNGTTYPVVLRYTTILENSGDTKYAYYNLTDDQTLEIRFSSEIGSFTPSVNSTLVANIYTTLGSEGNMTYTGDVLFRISNENFRSLPITASFDSSYTSVGGVDAPTLAKIKNLIINEISTRDVIVTESDLNTYFAALTAKLQTINKGKITFVKKRDDILRRIFTTYILMRDGLDADGNDASSNYISNVIPTNTIDATITYGNFGSLNKQFGDVITRDTNALNKYSFKSGTTGTSDYYILPFYMDITLEPFKKVRYIYNLANDSQTLTYKYVNIDSDSLVIIPSTVSVERYMDTSTKNKDISNYYTFSFKYITNFDAQITDYSGNILKLQAYNYQSSVQQTLSVDKVTVISDAQKDSDGNETGYYNTTFEFNVDVDQTSEFDFSKESAIYLNAGNRALTENVKMSLKFENYIVDDVVVNATYVSGNYLSLFRNLDNLMFSDMIVNTDSSNAITSIEVKDIPVIHSSFFDNVDVDKTEKKFISQLFKYIDMLNENFSKLETSTFFDLKFYNTYGPSQYYSTKSTNLNLEMNIILLENESVETWETSIKDFVRRLVDSYNDGEELKISQIITMTTANFSTAIDHIEFTGLNGTFNQYINKLDNTDDTKYAAEYFNISKDSIDNIKVLAYDEQ